MGLTSTAILSAVELPIYIILLPCVCYLIYRHGEPGFLGYFYLSLSCGVRLAADVVNLVEGAHSDSNKNTTSQPTIAQIVIGSIGLSPLLLALAGMVHELHHHMLGATKTIAEAKSVRRWVIFAQVQIHGLNIVGMVLLIIGGIHIAEATPTTDISGDEKLRYGGAIILLVAYLALAQYSGWLLFRCHKCRINLGTNMLNLSKWSFVAALVIGIRVIYTVVYTFDHTDTALSPITGAFAVKVVVTVLVTLGAVLAMAFAGWKSRDITRHRRLAFARHQEQSNHLNMQQKVVTETTPLAE